jgi:hypothetical protein
MENERFPALLLYTADYVVILYVPANKVHYYVVALKVIAPLVVRAIVVLNPNIYTFEVVPTYVVVLNSPKSGTIGI